MLNIPSDNDDPAYRYKMPKLQSRKEGRGNGSKTGILNMSDICRALKRDPNYLTKFMGYELGAQSSYTNKENEGERTVINGHHETNVFQGLVDKFIDRYVLCPGCKLPEIDMIVKGGFVRGGCKACGWAGCLDNEHKLATYIIKNPPGTGIGFDQPKEKLTKQERQEKRAKKEKKGHKDDEDDETGTASGSDKEKEKGEKKEKKEKKDKKDKKDKKEKKEKKEHKDGDEDGDEGVKEKKEKKDKKHKKDKKDKKDKKEKKEKKAKAEKSDDESGSGSDDEGEMTWDGDQIQATAKDVTEFVEKKGSGLKVDDMFEEVRAQQVTRGFNDKLRLYIVVSALFPDGSMSSKTVTAKKAYLKRFIENAKMSFADYIWGMQAYLEKNSSAVKGFPMVLKALYDEDLATEEQILKYYKGTQDAPGFETAKKAAAPFLKWLETANDSEESGSDDSDSD